MCCHVKQTIKIAMYYKLLFDIFFNLILSYYWHQMPKHHQKFVIICLSYIQFSPDIMWYKFWSWTKVTGNILFHREEYTKTRHALQI